MNAVPEQKYTVIENIVHPFFFYWENEEMRKPLIEKLLIQYKQVVDSATKDPKAILVIHPSDRRMPDLINATKSLIAYARKKLGERLFIDSNEEFEGIKSASELPKFLDKKQEIKINTSGEYLDFCAQTYTNFVWLANRGFRLEYGSTRLAGIHSRYRFGWNKKAEPTYWNLFGEKQKRQAPKKRIRRK